jgi:hypothetical protein
MTSNSLVVYTPEKQREIQTLLGLEGTSAHINLLFQLAERYDLDPLTKEISLIPKKGPFIGVWGRLHIAQRSGLLDGLEADEEFETDKHYCCRVIVWRKDQGRPAAKVIGRVGKHEGSNDKQTGEWRPKEWPLEVARARGLRAALGFAFSIHDVYDHDDQGDEWEPPPDERTPSGPLQATVIDVDVPAAAAPGEEAPTQPAAKPKKRATKAVRGSTAGPDPTSGHTGSGGEPPPAAEPQPTGVAVETATETGRGGQSPATPEQPTLHDGDPPTLIVGGHILAQKLAIAARHAGIDDDQTRHDVITAATGAAATRGQEVTDEQAPRVLAAFNGLADGSVELRYHPNGTPHLVRPRRP